MQNLITEGVNIADGFVAGDRFSNKWDGIVIGGNAKKQRFRGPHVEINRYLQSSDVDKSSRLLDKCNSPGVDCSVISYREGATIDVDVSRSVYFEKARDAFGKKK